METSTFLAMVSSPFSMCRRTRRWFGSTASSTSSGMLTPWGVASRKNESLPRDDHPIRRPWLRHDARERRPREDPDGPRACRRVEVDPHARAPGLDRHALLVVRLTPSGPTGRQALLEDGGP